jgi:Putative stress-responsive transcriptional regulator
MSDKKLSRSTGNKILGGLCGGLGEYFNIDPTIIRLIWILAVFWIGIPAIIAYFLGLIVVSTTGQKDGAGKVQSVVMEQNGETAERRPAASKPHIIWGWLIIGAGVVILFQSLGYFEWAKQYVFPGVLIIAGIWVLIMGFKRK